MDFSNLANKYNLKLLVLFGSQATGQTHKDSDTDIAYFSFAPLSLFDESKLIVDLQEIVKNNVDLVDLRRANPLLKNQIFQNGKALFESTNGLFVDSYLQARRSYDEHLPLYQAKLALL
ncbi:MAG: nucleotidyltransferase domain-containing protein [Patescibacteria group bacterium]